jgi:hypothetical protein
MFFIKRNQNRKPLPVFLYGKPVVGQKEKEEPAEEKSKKAAKTGGRKPKKEIVVEPVIDQVTIENNETENAE